MLMRAYAHLRYMGARDLITTVDDHVIRVPITCTLWVIYTVHAVKLFSIQTKLMQAGQLCVSCLPCSLFSRG